MNYRFCDDLHIKSFSLIVSQNLFHLMIY